MNSKTKLLIAGVSTALFCSGNALSQIYQWKDHNGNVHFSDTPSGQHPVKQVDIQVNTYQQVDLQPLSKSVGKQVIMYSASWCGVCKRARRFFVQNNINFKEYDVETSKKGRADYKQLRAKGVPVILVGDQQLNGFSAKTFNRMYRGTSSDVIRLKTN